MAARTTFRFDSPTCGYAGAKAGSAFPATPAGFSEPCGHATCCAASGGEDARHAVRGMQRPAVLERPAIEDVPRRHDGGDGRMVEPSGREQSRRHLERP